MCLVHPLQCPLSQFSATWCNQNGSRSRLILCSVSKSLCFHFWLMCAPQMAGCTKWDAWQHKSSNTEWHMMDMLIHSSTHNGQMTCPQTYLARHRTRAQRRNIFSGPWYSGPDWLKRTPDLVEGLVQTLMDFRHESFFDNLWGEVLNICEQRHAATRQRKTSCRLCESHICLLVRGSKIMTDYMLNELSWHCSKTNCELRSSFRPLNPKQWLIFWKITVCLKLVVLMMPILMTWIHWPSMSPL